MLTHSRLLLALLGALLVSPVEAGWVWTAKDGWRNTNWEELSTPPELLLQSEKAFEKGAYADAIEGFERLISAYPNSDEAKKGYLKLYEAQYLVKNYADSLATIEALLAAGTDTDTKNRLVQRKFDIGMRYLEGTKRSLFGIPVSGKSYGIRILKEVADQHPFQSISDDALYHVALTYFEDEEYEAASAIYERLVRVYPKSEWAGNAEYQIGESALRRLKGVEYDFALVDEAERRFQRYIQRFPRGGKQMAAQKRLQEIDALRAEKLLSIARFYLKEKRPKAARYYLQKVWSNHPDAPAAREARRLLRSPEAQDAK